MFPIKHLSAISYRLCTLPQAPNKLRPPSKQNHFQNPMKRSYAWIIFIHQLSTIPTGTSFPPLRLLTVYFSSVVSMLQKESTKENYNGFWEKKVMLNHL